MASATTCKRDVDNGKMRFTPPSSYRTSAPSAASAPATPNECQSSFDVPDAELQSPLSSLANSPSRKPMHDLSQLINASDQIGASVMVIRALIVFCFTLIFLRIAGRRSFGQRSAFDLCITVLLGAILSRAIVGASPLLPTLAAGAVLVLSHRLLGILITRNNWLDDLVSGPERLLVEDGRINTHQMRAGLISERDLVVALRKKGDGATLARVARAVLERNGEITITLQAEAVS